MFGFRNIYLCLRWFSFFLFALHRHISSRSCACCSWLWCFSRINFRNISFDCCGSSGTLKYNKIWFYYRPSSCQVKLQICYIHAKHPKKQMKDRKSLEEKKASTNFFHLEVLCNETGVRRDMSKLYASPLHLFFLTDSEWWCMRCCKWTGVDYDEMQQRAEACWAKSCSVKNESPCSSKKIRKGIPRNP